MSAELHLGKRVVVFGDLGSVGHRNEEFVSEGRAIDDQLRQFGVLHSDLEDYVGVVFKSLDCALQVVLLLRKF